MRAVPAFDFSQSRDPIRADLANAYRSAWDHVAAPGTWLTGAERVAVAQETRLARDCRLCAERKAALSPFAVSGAHDDGGRLSAPLVDAVHRVTTDAARLSEGWYRGLLAEGLSDAAYVEALGVAVVTISIDRFHQALDLPLEPLPAPREGEPSRARPEGLVEGEAWVPLQGGRQLAQAMGMPVPSAPYVIRALSLVPDEVLAWRRVSAAQYLAEDEMMRFEQTRAISRSQIELVAGRVSALNECFY